MKKIHKSFFFMSMIDNIIAQCDKRLRETKIIEYQKSKKKKCKCISVRFVIHLCKGVFKKEDEENQNQ